ncbi:hypothetical protein [Spirosoma areae]
MRATFVLPVLVRWSGRRDVGELGIGGVVRLLPETIPGNYTVVPATIISGGGLYLFPNLPAGTNVAEFDNTTYLQAISSAPNPTSRVYQRT